MKRTQRLHNYAGMMDSFFYKILNNYSRIVLMTVLSSTKKNSSMGTLNQASGIKCSFTFVYHNA